jgi:hypothetical protein
VTFHIPSTTVKDYLPRLVDVLHEKLKTFVVPPSRIQRRVNTGPLKGACLFVDSLPIPLDVRPDFGKKESKDRSKYYWYAGAKATKWALKAQTTLGFDGKIWDTAHVVPYASSDQQLFKDSSVPAILNQDEDLRGIGDSHYSKQTQMIPKVPNPKSAAQKSRNKAIEKIRASIEHTVRRLKIFKIVKDRYRGDRTNLLLVEKVVRIAAALINLEIENHPIQSNLRRWKRLPKRNRKS